MKVRRWEFDHYDGNTTSRVRATVPEQRVSHVLEYLDKGYCTICFISGLTLRFKGTEREFWAGMVERDEV